MWRSTVSISPASSSTILKPHCLQSHLLCHSTVFTSQCPRSQFLHFARFGSAIGVQVSCFPSRVLNLILARCLPAPSSLETYNVRLKLILYSPLNTDLCAAQKRLHLSQTLSHMSTSKWSGHCHPGLIPGRTCATATVAQAMADVVHINCSPFWQNFLWIYNQIRGHSSFNAFFWKLHTPPSRNANNVAACIFITVIYTDPHNHPLRYVASNGVSSIYKT